MKKILIQQGAEAKIYLSRNKIIKQREKKNYRHEKLDEQIRKRRTKSEAKILQKAKDSKTNVPQIINISKYELELEYIPGEKLSKILNSLPQKEQIQIMQKLATQISKLHENDIIHGDLTTSNFILLKNKVFLIDFGLSYISKKIEDKAVDIHLLKQALEAKHFENYKLLFDSFIKKYKTKESEKILERLKEVEKRGRYKH